MAEQKFYYRIFNDETGAECYAKCNLHISPQGFLELLGISGAYDAEEVTAEEYYANTDEEE